MIKIIQFIIISGLTLCILQIGFSKPYEAQVKGSYKTMTATEYKYKGNKVDINSAMLMSKITLDDKGNEILIENYEKNIVTYTARFENKYDSKGRLSEYTCYDEASKPLFNMKYEYDAKGNKLSDIQTKSTGDESISNFYKYDENNFVIEESHKYKSPGYESPLSTTYLKNDKYGNKIEESVDASMEISAEVSSEQTLGENQSTKSETSVKSKTQKSANTYEYTYDDKGRIIIYKMTTHSGYISKHEIRYDQYGNTTEDIYYDENGKPYSKLVYEYSK